MTNLPTSSQKAIAHTAEAHESMAEMRDHCNQYLAHMVDLLFEGQKENLKLLSQIQKSMLKNGKSFSETLNHNGNGYAASHQASSDDLFKSMMDIGALILDSAHMTAEKSANIAKGSMINHKVKSQPAQQHGKH